jgi:CRP/FNR family transcriptional regulator
MQYEPGEDLLRQATRLHLAPGTVLFRPGELCAGFPVLLTGGIRVTRLCRTGREMLLYRVGPRETCITTTACLLSGEAYAVSGVVEAETEALLLTPPRFETLLSESASFRHLVFQGFATRLAQLMQRIEDISGLPVEARLAALLLRQAGTETTISATHQALALEIGSAREVVTRVLARLTQAGLLRLGRGRIEILHPARLAALAEPV